MSDRIIWDTDKRRDLMQSIDALECCGHCPYYKQCTGCISCEGYSSGIECVAAKYINQHGMDAYQSCWYVNMAVMVQIRSWSYIRSIHPSSNLTLWINRHSVKQTLTEWYTRLIMKKDVRISLKRRWMYYIFFIFELALNESRLVWKAFLNSRPSLFFFQCLSVHLIPVILPAILWL